MVRRIFFATGPGNLILAHKHWVAGIADPSQMSLTYSGQIADFCKEVGAEAYLVSYNTERRIVNEGQFILEHRPKPRFGSKGGLRFHLSEIIYGLSLLSTAVRFKADFAVLHSGSTHFFVMSIFRLAGIKVVPELHNTLWPAGYPPTKVSARILLTLNTLFFRHAASAVIAVSPECARQVDQITSGQQQHIYEIRGQFSRSDFTEMPPPPVQKKPLRIYFAGRIERNKGVFDILEIAERIDAIDPGRVSWEMCGTGSDLDHLKKMHALKKLQNIVAIHGFTPPPRLREVIAQNHLAIVPTRSDFNEGMAMTVVEPILSGRPAITNSVVPALEVLRPGCLEAETNDVASYVRQILRLVKEPDLYETLCKACLPLQEQFYDRNFGLSAILKRIVLESFGPGKAVQQPADVATP
jgi:glycogen(starch) synthase